MFYVYVLKSEKTGRRYVGSCQNILERLHRHNTNQSKATKYGIPWILIHNESFRTRAEVVQKGIYYKTGRGRDELNAML